MKREPQHDHLLPPPYLDVRTMLALRRPQSKSTE